MSAREIYILKQGEKRPFAVDFGENTAGSTTGPLPPGDTVASATVALQSYPTGASSPTLGSPSANATTEYVNGRACSAGEAVTFAVTLGASQTVGDYVLEVTATTTAGYILIDWLRFTVTE